MTSTSPIVDVVASATSSTDSCSDTTTALISLRDSWTAADGTAAAAHNAHPSTSLIKHSRHLRCPHASIIIRFSDWSKILWHTLHCESGDKTVAVYSIFVRNCVSVKDAHITRITIDAFAWMDYIIYYVLCETGSVERQRRNSVWFIFFMCKYKQW